MIISRTPLRVSFAGGGTDFPSFYREHGGKVVSIAIDKFIYVIVKRRWDKKIYVNYSRKEIVEHVDELQHELVREAMRIAGVNEGIEITTLSDIPSEGSGLGSSSAVTVGLLNALHSYRGRQVPNETLAEQACEIELERLKKPMGVQDAWPCAMGGLRAYEFGPKDEMRHVAVALDGEGFAELQRRMTLFYTGVTRSSGSVLTEQQSSIKQNASELIGLRDLAHSLHSGLEREGLDCLGQTLNAGWALKKNLASNVSDEKIDRLIEGCLSAGADGVKICGAGGGGFILVVASQGKIENIRSFMGDAWELPVQVSQYGSQIIFGS